MGQAAQVQQAAVEIVQRIAVGRRTFLVRSFPLGKFRFEACEQTADGRLINGESYRLLVLAEMDLQTRVRNAKAAAGFLELPAPRIVTNAYGAQMLDDPERLDRYREFMETDRVGDDL